jgi:hypothetical protein
VLTGGNRFGEIAAISWLARGSLCEGLLQSDLPSKLMNASKAFRLLLWIGAVFGLLGLFINAIDWWNGSLVFAGPKLADQIGMLILLAAVLLGQISIALRNSLIVLAMVLIVPSTMSIFWRAL